MDVVDWATFLVQALAVARLELVISAMKGQEGLRGRQLRSRRPLYIGSLFNYVVQLRAN